MANYIPVYPEHIVEDFLFAHNRPQRLSDEVGIYVLWKPLHSQVLHHLDSASVLYMYTAGLIHSYAKLGINCHST